MLQWMLMMKSPIQPQASNSDPLEPFLRKFKQLKAVKASISRREGGGMCCPRIIQKGLKSIYPWKT